MKDNFSSCLAIILKEEGGSDDDPRDPGGRTSRGIIQREWNVYRQTHPNRPQDVWQASNEDVADIYCQQYWQPYCDKMPIGVDLVFFNTCVNSGRQQAVKELQRAVGVTADGMMGMMTFDALNSRHDTPSLIHNLCDQRRKFYKALKTFQTFGKGWLARTKRIEDTAVAMAAHAGPSNVIVSEHPDVDTKPKQPEITVSPKAPTSQADKPTVSPETSGSATAGLGSLIAVINSIKDQLGNFTTLVPNIQYVLLALTIIGIGYTIYSTIKRNKINAVVG
jgi:lysozyme family protein